MTDDKNIINIDNIFSIGYRCNSCEFLEKYLNIRKYSSPFSYVVIDINTALNFIDTKFETYVDMKYIRPGNKKYKFNNREWTSKFIHSDSILNDEKSDILEMDKICIWCHHNLNDINIKKSFNKRSEHLLFKIHNTPNTCLLFYIEKLQNYDENIINYFNTDLLKKYECKFLIIIPLLNFNKDPFLFYEDDKIKIIYFNSNTSGWGVDAQCNANEWIKLKNLINSLYHFDIEDYSISI